MTYLVSGKGSGPGSGWQNTRRTPCCHVELVSASDKGFSVLNRQIFPLRPQDGFFRYGHNQKRIPNLPIAASYNFNAFTYERGLWLTLNVSDQDRRSTLSSSRVTQQFLTNSCRFFYFPAPVFHIFWPTSAASRQSGIGGIKGHN